MLALLARLLRAADTRAQHQCSGGARALRGL